jgi:hypothetical protein
MILVEAERQNVSQHLLCRKNPVVVLCTCQSFLTSLPVYESVEEISKTIIATPI